MTWHSASKAESPRSAKLLHGGRSVGPRSSRPIIRGANIEHALNSATGDLLSETLVEILPRGSEDTDPEISVLGGP